MPRRKVVPPAAASSSLSPSPKPSPAPKRQRVSVACNPCRLAREKCDGVRPSCGTCAAQNRSCVFIASSKKRGVQTGYLKATEMSLAWVMENVEGAQEGLREFLENERGANVLLGKSAASHKLARRWSKGPVHKLIESRLSNKPVSTNNEFSDASELESDAWMASDTSPAAPPSQPSPTRRRTYEAQRLVLPAHWRNHLQIYFTYIHPWLPILEQQRLLAVAASYPTDGLSIHASDSREPEHAELWAAFAVGATQHAASSDSPSDGPTQANYIRTSAQQLIPADEAELTLPSIRAMLLQCIMLIGAGKLKEAWFLMGRISRGYDYIRPQGVDYIQQMRECKTAAACFVLDTLLSAALQRHPSWKLDRQDSWDSLASSADDTGGHWAAVPGFGDASSSTTSSALCKPDLTLYQLVDFCLVLGSCSNTPNALLSHLHPEFSFCNVLVSDTPTQPSSLLVHILFITASTQLHPEYRLSLLDTLLEQIEACMSSFGACGTPPVIQLVLAIVKAQSRYAQLPASSRQKWEDVAAAVSRAWTEVVTSPSTTGSFALPRAPEATLQPPLTTLHPYHTPISPLQTTAAPYLSQMDEQRDAAGGRLSLGAEAAIDYGAIFNDIEGVQYVDLDTGGVDSQFMTNLGFAPSCDLGDRFRADMGF